MSIIDFTHTGPHDEVLQYRPVARGFRRVLRVGAGGVVLAAVTIGLMAVRFWFSMPPVH